MFVEVIRGSTGDRDGTRRQTSQWMADLARHLPGWRGTTAGVATNGAFIAMTEVDSEAAPSPKQDRTRTATPALFEGERSIVTYDRVTLRQVSSDAEAAGFVQFILGQVRNVVEADQYLREFDAVYAPLRPDCVGRLMASRDDGRYVGAFYFTSEQQARAAEAHDVPPDIADLIQRGQALSDGPGTYIDLASPWIRRPSPAMA